MSSSRRERLCVGVLSGTSADAVEVAICRITGSGGDVRLVLEAHHSLGIPASLTREIHDENLSPVRLSQLNVALGELFAQAVLEAVAKAGLSTESLDVIGSHGQTIAHVPPGAGTASTLQLGSAAVIAERTGCRVVSDFRSRDLAAGGQGAPLVPYLDWAVFRRPGEYRALHNLGGIGNVSVVSDRLEDTIAFDTGPANMVLDAITRRATGGRQTYDREGLLASRGQIMPRLLEELLAHPFLSKTPPKSAGRELFGDVLVESLWARYPTRPNDLLATAVAYTLESTARAYEQFIFPKLGARRLEGIYFSGGGTRNPLLFEGLKERLASIPVHRLDVLDFPEGAKEAALFALLASEHLEGVPANVPNATGARHQVVLGSLTP